MTKKPGSNGGLVTIIFNSIRPYAYEVNNILSLPNDFTYRFRYRTRWISKDLKPADLKGDGLAVLRNFVTAQFVPLRRIRIVDVVEVGDILHITYRLGDIVEFDSDEAVRGRQLVDFNERMKPAIKDVENQPGKNLTRLIFKYPDLAYGIKNDHYQGSEENRVFNSWGNLIQIMGQMEDFVDFDFLKVLDIVDNNGQAAKIVTDPDPNPARFHLKSDTLCKARVFQRAFTNREGDSAVLSARQINLEGEPAAIRTIRATHSVAGKYDMMEFSFKTEPVTRQRDGSLFLAVRREGIVTPDIEIPIRIVVSSGRQLLWITSSIVFLAGIALLFGADSISVLLKTKADLVARIGILLALLSAYGGGPFVKSFMDKIGVKYSV